MCFNQTGDISTQEGTSLKLVDKFTNLGNSVSSTEKYIDTRLTKAWTAIDNLSIIWKSDLTDKMKRSFFQAAVVSILLYGCTIWTLTKRLEKKLDVNYTRMLRAILNKSWRQHLTKHQLYSHLPPIKKTIHVRRTKHAGHCWTSRDELISDVLLWTPTYGRAKEGRPARTNIQQLFEDTGCNPEYLPEVMNNSKKWRERVRVLVARHDDEDDDLFIYLLTYFVKLSKFIHNSDNHQIRNFSMKAINWINCRRKNEKELGILIHTVRIYSQDIGTEFGIEKCAMLVMKRDKRHLTE